MGLAPGLTKVCCVVAAQLIDGGDCDQLEGGEEQETQADQLQQQGVGESGGGGIIHSLLDSNVSTLQHCTMEISLDIGN